MVFVGPATRCTIHDKFGKLKLLHPYSGKLWWRLSPTIGRLKEVGIKNPEKFKVYMKLIEKLISLARDDKDERKYTVHVPSVKALLGIRIEALMQNAEARQEIVSQCYRPDQEAIELRKLITINRHYFPKIKIED